MEDTIKKYYRPMSATAANYISKSVKEYLPESTQKDFMLWMLADQSPYQEGYLRMMGVAGSIELELKLLGDVVTDTTLQQLDHYIGLLNDYFAFETLSDNIGSGLSVAKRDLNPTYEQQKKLLIGFNDAMIQKLQGDKRSSIELLLPYADLTKSISAYEHCLLPSQMHQFAKAYQESHPAASLTDLEYSFLPILILNIETCVQLLDSMRNHPIYFLLQDSLIARYTSVNELLKTENIEDLTKLADLGTKSILVIPTLAFCIGALDTVLPNKSLTKIAIDGFLSRSLYLGSSLVRLLNDVGTNLLSFTQKERSKIFDDLKPKLQSDKFSSIFKSLLIVAEAKESFYNLSRIRKDLHQGEFNICIDNLDSKKNKNEALVQFFENVNFYSELYQQQIKELHNLCEVLQKQLGTNNVGQIILNFVAFHQEKYSKEYETKYGDYAITSSSFNDDL